MKNQKDKAQRVGGTGFQEREQIYGDEELRSLSVPKEVPELEALEGRGQ